MRPAVRITFLVLIFLVIAILSKGLYNPEIIYLVTKFTILIIQISVKILIFLFLTLLIIRCM